MARCLASAGATIATNSRNGAEAEAAAREIALEFGVETFGTAADVTDEESVAEFVSEASKILGPIDILVNNAGVNFRKPTTEMPLSEWKRVLDINLTGPFICSKAVLPEMVARGWGRIIHLSSMLGTVGLADRTPYTASKGD
jgi:short-subunit dehydrogenase